MCGNTHQKDPAVRFDFYSLPFLWLSTRRSASFLCPAKTNHYHYFGMKEFHSGYTDYMNKGDSY